jgi:hypothetical protein
MEDTLLECSGRVLLTIDFTCSHCKTAMEETVAYRIYVIRLCLLETCE